MHDIDKPITLDLTNPDKDSLFNEIFCKKRSLLKSREAALKKI